MLARTSILALLLLAACDDTEKVDDTSTTDTDTADTDTDTQEGGLSHAEDIQPIWDASCSSCHTGGSTLGDLDLDDGYATMVGVASGQVPSMMLVKAASSDESYLWHKLQGTQEGVGGLGGQMPKNGELDASDLSLIQVWINEAAQP